MYASVLLVALSGYLVPAAVLVETPLWFTDYSVARQRGKDVGKPLAVFIGAGQSGWEQVSRAGQLDKEARRILASHYVSVYIDSTEQAGKRLASAFQVPQGRGLVISDFSGDVQAFHYTGDLAAVELNRSLQRYSDPDRLIRLTETNPTRPVSSATAPAVAPPPRFAPLSSGMFFGGGRSSC